MRTYVVDASVAAKWFLPEAGADKAQRLLSGRYTLIAPVLLWVEVASVLWKHVRKRFMSPDEAERMLQHAMVFPVELHDLQPLLAEALHLALEHDRTIYDCLYLALASHAAATLVTEDTRLVRSLANTSLARRVCTLDDLG